MLVVQNVWTSSCMHEYMHVGGNPRDVIQLNSNKDFPCLQTVVPESCQHQKKPIHSFKNQYTISKD